MRQFYVPRPNVYECSDGYAVEILGQTGLAYKEQGKCMFVDSEVLMPPAGILVYQGTIDRWQPPHDHQTLSPSDRARIVANILELLGSQGVEVQVI